MNSFQTLVFLMFSAAILVGIAQKIRIPYPIALILGGLTLGFIPGLHLISLDPNLILLIVLPPILYYAAFAISLREFKKNWRDIFSLALGLVVATTFVIGILFKWIFPEIPWALCFAFGAIVSPPDAVAATTILKRYNIGDRLLTILEGESLVNDASALVLYKIAVAALLTGVFSFEEASLNFGIIVTGGVLVGAVLGILMQNFSRLYLEPLSGVVFSFTIPYVTYIIADSLGVSGVLAVVVNGLIGSQVLLKHPSSLRRILGFGAWDIIIILLNCFVFILIGLQFRYLSREMTGHEIALYFGYALLIMISMVLVRIAWIYGRAAIAYLKALRKPKSAQLCPLILQDAAILGWSGMRGIVSLVAALALPALPGRDQVVFITFGVILLTLLIPGFTLAPLIRWLKVKHSQGHYGIFRVRKKLYKAAKLEIARLHTTKIISDEEYNFLNSYFNNQQKLIEISTSNKQELKNFDSIRQDIIHEQRKRLIEMWERREIDDKLLTLLEHELDVEETRVARAAFRT